MKRHHWARIGVAAILAPWLAAALVAAGYFGAIHWATAPCSCTTDTECMQMHGGDGGPESTPTTDKEA